KSKVSVTVVAKIKSGAPNSPVVTVSPTGDAESELIAWFNEAIQQQRLSGIESVGQPASLKLIKAGFAAEESVIHVVGTVALTKDFVTRTLQTEATADVELGNITIRWRPDGPLMQFAPTKDALYSQAESLLSRFLTSRLPLTFAGVRILNFENVKYTPK